MTYHHRLFPGPWSIGAAVLVVVVALALNGEVRRPDDSRIVTGSNSESRTSSAVSIDGILRGTEDPAQDLALHSTAPPAGDGETLESVRAYTLAGRTLFTATYSYEVGGKIQQFSRIPGSPESVKSEEYLDFLLQYESSLDPMVGYGSAVPTGVETLAVDGIQVRFRKYRLELPEWGEVIYWVGQPTP
jgi:hypothetical protein